MKLRQYLVSYVVLMVIIGFVSWKLLLLTIPFTVIMHARRSPWKEESSPRKRSTKRGKSSRGRHGRSRKMGI